jgi:hypothetical protein
MHGSMGGGRKPSQSGSLSRAARAPLAYRPTSREQHLGLMGSMASERIAQFFIRSPGVAVPVDESAAGKLRRRRAGRWRRISRCSARGRVRAGFEACAHNTPVIGVQSVASWPCGQDSRLQPGCPRRRYFRHQGVWRGLLVLTAGLVPYFYGRYLTGSVASSLRD